MLSCPRSHSHAGYSETDEDLRANYHGHGRRTRTQDRPCDAKATANSNDVLLLPCKIRVSRDDGTERCLYQRRAANDPNSI